MNNVAPSQTQVNWGKAMFTVICLLLSILPLMGGVGLTARCSRVLVRWMRMRTWVEKTALLQQVELKEYYDDEVGVYHLIRCVYGYQHEGKQFVGRRVGLMSRRGDKEVYQRLELAQAQQRPVPCFVNPVDPTEAILCRDLISGDFAELTVWSAAAVVFLGLGAVLLCCGLGWAVAPVVRRIHNRRRARAGTGQLAGRLPAPCEQARGDAGYPTFRGWLYLVWFAAATWNIVTLPAVFVGLFDAMRHPVCLAYVSALAVPGAAMLWAAIWLSRRRPAG